MNLKRIAKPSTQACETQNQITRYQAIDGLHWMCDMQVSSSFEVPLSPESRRFPHSFADRTWLRIRHVKCDEAKPSCLRCTSTGRRRDDYVPTGVLHLDVDVPGDYEERRGYHYFRLKSAGENTRTARCGLLGTLVPLGRPLATSCQACLDCSCLYSRKS